MIVTSASRVSTGSASNSRWAAKMAASAAEPLAGAPFQLLAFGAHREQRLLQRLAFGHHIAGLVGNVDALGNMANQLADR